MLFCLPCEQIVLIRLNQGKGFIEDLCPVCRQKMHQALRAKQTG